MDVNESQLKNIGPALARERKRRGMTQSQLAYMLGYTNHSHISNIERGKKIPNLSTLEKLTIIFDVDINYFLTKI